MSIYQFLIAVRQNGENLMNDSGETTSHLMGMFYRTIRMIENGIKPVYVFDGKAPQLKSKELEKRLERRTEAEAEMTKAADAGKELFSMEINRNEKRFYLGDEEAVDKFVRRTVKVTREHNDDCKRLLRLMGVPYVEAPTEAESRKIVLY
jgi:flap endonuclease-1